MSRSAVSILTWFIYSDDTIPLNEKIEAVRSLGSHLDSPDAINALNYLAIGEGVPPELKMEVIRVLGKKNADRT